MTTFGGPQLGLPDNRPTSPPATPGHLSYPQFPSAASHTSPFFKRAGGFFHNLSQSPPLDDNIKPIGQGPNFLFTRLQAEEPSSRPSTASGFASVGSHRQSSPEIESAQESKDKPAIIRRRHVQDSDLTIEEIIGSEPDYPSDIEVLRPDPSDDSDSEYERPQTAGTDSQSGLVRGFQRIQFDENCTEDEKEAQRRLLRRRKRWSQRSFKRSHSQSVGSDTDGDDADGLDAHDMGSSARRLRRRVKGPGHRASLIFDENPRDILEVEEPGDEFPDAAPSPLDLNAPSMQALEVMPFWVLEDPMEIDSDSGRSIGK